MAATPTTQHPRVNRGSEAAFLEATEQVRERLGYSQALLLQKPYLAPAPIPQVQEGVKGQSTEGPFPVEEPRARLRSWGPGLARGGGEGWGREEFERKAMTNIAY